jgi:hypothetical protein
MRTSGQVETGRSMLRRRELLGRVALLAGALVLAGGIVVFLQSRSNNDPGPTTAHAPTQPNPYVASDVRPGGVLPEEAKRVTARFVLTALSREHLAEAWDLVTPAFRSGVTRKQWLNGELPVPPFPVDALDTTGFKVLGTAANKVVMQIFLVPRANSGLTPTRYNVTVIRVHGTWKISYAQPYAPPGVYAPPS